MLTKKLALGLFCAGLCGANLAVARSLQGEEKGTCEAYACVKDTTCRYEVSCASCLVFDPELGLGFCLPYL